MGEGIGENEGGRAGKRNFFYQDIQFITGSFATHYNDTVKQKITERQLRLSNRLFVFDSYYITNNFVYERMQFIKEVLIFEGSYLTIGP